MKNHTTKLIDGVFTQPKANDILIELMHHKINYHKLQRYISEIRYERDKEHSEKRIKELTEASDDLKEWLNSIDQNQDIEIRCIVEMKVK